MALPTGTINMSDVNVELRRPWNQRIDLNDSQVRQLAGRPSGTISMADLRGKSSTEYVNVVGWRNDRQNTQVDVNGSSASTSVYGYFYTGPDYGYNEIGYKVTGGKIPKSVHLRVVYYPPTGVAGTQTREYTFAGSTELQKGARFGSPYPRINTNIEFYFTFTY